MVRLNNMRRRITTEIWEQIDRERHDPRPSQWLEDPPETQERPALCERAFRSRCPLREPTPTLLTLMTIAGAVSGGPCPSGQQPSPARSVRTQRPSHLGSYWSAPILR